MVFTENLNTLNVYIFSQCMHSCLQKVAFADDLNGAGKTISLLEWWKYLLLYGPKIGYYPEPSKSWLIVKSQHLEEATHLFKDSQVNINDDGRKHLGAAVGSNTFKESYVTNKVEEWVRQLAILSTIAKTQPQSAYVAFVTGFHHKFNYTFCTINGIKHLLNPYMKGNLFHCQPNWEEWAS